jgi:hypothetical protein
VTTAGVVPELACFLELSGAAYTPGPVRRRGIRTVLVTAILVTAAGMGVALGSCDGPPDEPETPAEVLERGGSIARVTIGADIYDFEVSCYDVGAGSVIAVGTGTVVGTEGEDTDRATRLFVQAFLGDSYVGLTVELPATDDDPADAADEEVFEAALDDSIDLVLEDDVIVAADIDFVRNLDLTGGDGEAVGTGSLRVTCSEYEQGEPPGLAR